MVSMQNSYGRRKETRWFQIEVCCRHKQHFGYLMGILHFWMRWQPKILFENAPIHEFKWQEYWIYFDSLFTVNDADALFCSYFIVVSNTTRRWMRPDMIVMVMKWYQIYSRMFLTKSEEKTNVILKRKWIIMTEITQRTSLMVDWASNSAIAIDLRYCCFLPVRTYFGYHSSALSFSS